MAIESKSFWINLLKFYIIDLYLMSIDLVFILFVNWKYVYMFTMNSHCISVDCRKTKYNSKIIKYWIALWNLIPLLAFNENIKFSKKTKWHYGATKNHEYYAWYSIKISYLEQKDISIFTFVHFQMNFHFKI